MAKLTRDIVGWLITLSHAPARWANRQRRIATLIAASGQPVDCLHLDRPQRLRPMAVRKGGLT